MYLGRQLSKIRTKKPSHSSLSALPFGHHSNACLLVPKRSGCIFVSVTSDGEGLIEGKFFEEVLLTPPVAEFKEYQLNFMF